MIPEGVVLIWLGTIANIPAGWVRVVLLNGVFVKCSSDSLAPNTTGGSDTHTHTSPAHVHVMQHHVHSGETTRDSNYETDGGDNQGASRDQHVHGFTSSTTSGGDLNDGFTYGAGNSIPPFHEVIFITPSATFSPLRAGIVGFYASDELPIGWDFLNGDDDLEDLRNRYIKGAATGVEANTQGGSLAHTHDVSHGHTPRPHTHTGTTGGSSDGVRRMTNPGGAGGVVQLHSHNFTLNAISQDVAAYSGSVSVSSQEPAYMKLAAIQNNTGSVSRPKGIIGMWLGAINKIPIGWFYMNGEDETLDMRDRFVKVCNTLAEIGQIGGAHRHAHPDSNSHTHNANGSHSHTGGTDHRGETHGSNADNNGAAKGHSHQINSTSSTTCAYNGASFQGLENDAQPPFRTVAFIEFRYSMDGGLLLDFA